MPRPIPLLLVLVACTEGYQPADPTQVCADADAALASCGVATDESPFGTCQLEQQERAHDLLALHADQGCAGLTSTKADGVVCAAVPFLCVEHSVAELAPFSTDGCSMFPDGTLFDTTRWQHCCIEHDFAYYAGGDASLREAADAKLRTCIEQETNALVADLVYYGVRIGGSPALPTPWRWGYGWTYDPLDGFRSLPAAHASAAASQVAAYKAHPTPPLAFEQRLIAFADAILIVPGLVRAMQQVEAVIRTLE